MVRLTRRPGPGLVLRYYAWFSLCYWKARIPLVPQRAFNVMLDSHAYLRELNTELILQNGL